MTTRRGLLALGAVGGLAALGGCGSPFEAKDEKPVVYLYPEREAVVGVGLEWDGSLTYAYPEPRVSEGVVRWLVTASPDGELRDSGGRRYPSLFWEGSSSVFVQDEGFVVEAGGEVSFLEERLGVLGLSEREAAEFITYWGPRIRSRGRCLVSFAGEEFARRARYSFTVDGAVVVPDTFVRVYMVVGDVPEGGVPEQVLVPAPARTGFTVVEWGGTEQ